MANNNLVTIGGSTQTAKTTKKPATKATTQKSAPITANVVESEKGAEDITAVKDYSPQKTSVPKGYRGIRETLTQRGVNNDRIGYKDGYVTIDGQGLYKPTVNIDGTTYADEAAINNLTQQAYTMNKTPLVATRDYATSKGYGGAVNYDGTNPTIGGVAVKPVYTTEDGISYVMQSEADRLIKDFETANKIRTNKGVTDRYDEKYGEAERQALDKILNREAFSYEPDSDPVYEAYKKMYEREADEALRRVLNDNNTSVTGASGAVLSEAIAAQNDELQKITDVIPELYSSAYDRYIGETDRLRDNLYDVASVADRDYQRAYTENRDQIDDSITALQLEREEASRIENERRANEAAEVANRLSIKELEQAALQNAVSKGFFTPDDELILPYLANYRRADGTYSISPTDAEVQYILSTSDADSRAAYEAMLKYGM